MHDDVQQPHDTQAAPAAPADGIEVGMPQAWRARPSDRDARALLRWSNLAPRWLMESSVRAQREIWRMAWCVCATVTQPTPRN